MAWVGVTEAKNRLAMMMKRAQPAAEAPLNKRAKEAVEQMKRDVPVSSGKLRESIEARPLPTGAIIEAKEKYAWFVEHGTFKMPARPYFNPAIETMKRNLQLDYRNFLKGLK